MEGDLFLSERSSFFFLSSHPESCLKIKYIFVSKKKEVLVEEEGEGRRRGAKREE